MARWMVDANAYFTIPDHQQQARWEQVQAVSTSVSAEYLAVLDRGDLAAVEAAYWRLSDMFDLVKTISDWLLAWTR